MHLVYGARLASWYIVRFLLLLFERKYINFRLNNYYNLTLILIYLWYNKLLKFNYSSNLTGRIYIYLFIFLKKRRKNGKQIYLFCRLIRTKMPLRFHSNVAICSENWIMSNMLCLTLYTYVLNELSLSHELLTSHTKIVWFVITYETIYFEFPIFSCVIIVYKSHVLKVASFTLIKSWIFLCSSIFLAFCISICLLINHFRILYFYCVRCLRQSYLGAHRSIVSVIIKLH